MKRVLLLLLCAATVAHADPQEDTARRHAYYVARVRNGIFDARDRCREVFATLHPERMVDFVVKKPFLTLSILLPTIGGIVALHGQFMEPSRQALSASTAAHALFDQPLAEMSDADKEVVAQKLSVIELNWMRFSHQAALTTADTLGMRGYHSPGNRGGQFLTFELDSRHHEDISQSSVVGYRVPIEGPGGKVKDALPIHYLGEYRPYRRDLFAKLLKARHEGTVRDAVEDEYYNGEVDSPQQLGVPARIREERALIAFSRFLEGKRSGDIEADAKAMAGEEAKAIQARLENIKVEYERRGRQGVEYDSVLAHQLNAQFFHAGVEWSGRASSGVELESERFPYWLNQLNTPEGEATTTFGELAKHGGAFDGKGVWRDSQP